MICMRVQLPALGLALGVAALAIALASCSKVRPSEQELPTYKTEVRQILEKRCSECHGDSSSSGNFRVTSYVSTISCLQDDQRPATLPSDTSAPILAVLNDDLHRDLVNAEERGVLVAWVRAGSPAFVESIHPPGIINPRSAEFHGKTLREQRYRPMVDPNDPQACSRCHDGLSAKPAGVVLPAPGATSCQSCHQKPEGVLACPTCHGAGETSFPPSKSCFFPERNKRSGAHAAHVQNSANLGTGLPCSTCHPAPGDNTLSGTHANGVVEVQFDTANFGPEASYDRNTGVCSVSCHHRGGNAQYPTWGEVKTQNCSSCHQSPPAEHYPGNSCTTCHQQANAQGTALENSGLHLNGHVDLGDGSGKCGACHGAGDSPWPTTGAHPAHEDPSIASPITCETCHPARPEIFTPGHLDGQVQVELKLGALDRDSKAAWDGARCTNVACHGAGLNGTPLVTLTWNDSSGTPKNCGACHGLPPTQHTTSTSCERSDCHGKEVLRTGTNLAISESGKALHINGIIDFVSKQ
jgi:predicted CxxxxCH...CXXCH cytochrome family protein